MKTLQQPPEVLRFQCEHCGHPLIAPAKCVGRVVRCQECMKMMTVPASAVSMEDEVSSWIEQDLEQMWEEQEKIEKVQAPPKPVAPDLPPSLLNIPSPLTQGKRNNGPRPESPIAAKVPPVQAAPSGASSRGAASSPTATLCGHSRMVPIFN